MDKYAVITPSTKTAAAGMRCSACHSPLTQHGAVVLCPACGCEHTQGPAPQDFQVEGSSGGSHDPRRNPVKTP